MTNKKEKCGISKKRDFQFDIARCFAVFYVVAYFHLVPGYMNKIAINTLTNHYTYSLIFSVLGLFMFMSGFFLAKYRFTTKNDIIQFYSKRLKRFYPLYFFSLFTMLLGGWIPNFSIFLFSALGLSTIFTPQPKTLWFISMLFMFYMITPIIRGDYWGKWRNWNNIIGIIGGLFLIVVIDKILKIEIDKKIYWCYISYITGLLLGRTNIIPFITRNVYGGVIYLIIFLLTINHTDNYIECIVNIFSGILLFLYIAYFLSKIQSQFFFRIISQISYASMCAYLFHRHFYKIGRFLFEDGCFPIWFAFLIMVPIVFISSFYLQKFYDYSLKRVELLFCNHNESPFHNR